MMIASTKERLIFSTHMNHLSGLQTISIFDLSDDLTSSVSKNLGMLRRVEKRMTGRTQLATLVTGLDEAVLFLKHFQISTCFCKLLKVVELSEVLTCLFCIVNRYCYRLSFNKSERKKVQQRKIPVLVGTAHSVEPKKFQ